MGFKLSRARRKAKKAVKRVAKSVSKVAEKVTKPVKKVGKEVGRATDKAKSSIDRGIDKTSKQVGRTASSVGSKVGKEAMRTYEGVKKRTKRAVNNARETAPGHFIEGAYDFVKRAGRDVFDVTGIDTKAPGGTTQAAVPVYARKGGKRKHTRDSVFGRDDIGVMQGRKKPRKLGGTGRTVLGQGRGSKTKLG